jgi:transposase
MESKTLNRRRHSAELRAQVLSACAEPGASVAGVALQHGLNANLVHKWRRNETRRMGGRPAAGSALGEFIALPLPAACAVAAVPDIRIELRRGPTTVTVTWPTAAAGQCAAWLSQWLK